MSPIISVKNLKKTYKTHSRGQGLASAIASLFSRKYVLKEALKGISFEIQEGEVVGLIGPNGAGKSTTIKALSGVLFPTSGEIRVMGFVPWKDRVAYVKDIGVVFGQKEQLWWDLPAVDSFYLNKDLYGIPEPIFRENLGYMTKLVDIERIMNTPVRDLSLGERMKCKLVAALLHNPRLVFLDEPSIGLDVIAKDIVRDFIKNINQKRKTTFIITTHDMQDIEKLCKRIIIINYGEIVYDGPLAEIKKKYLNNKIIDIKFESPAKDFEHKGCRVLETQKYEMKIEVDTRIAPIKQVIEYIMKRFDFADLVINDPPIEAVIQRIYKEKR